jgi:hypothetical protein
MAVNKVRRLGSFAPLSAQAWKDDALAEAGEAAELLFYRALSFSADILADGFITDGQLVRLVGHGMKDVARRAERLVLMGLWTKEDGGYNVRSWLKWNRSLAEIQHLQSKDAGRKAPTRRDPDGDEPPPETDSERNPNGERSESESDTETAAAETCGHIQNQNQNHIQNQADNTSARGADARKARDTFPAFWDAYPRKTGKGDAEKAWAKATKGRDPQDLIAAAQSFAARRRSEDPQFTPYPATWLNRRSWEDEPDPPTLKLISGGYQPYQDPTDPDYYGSI